MIRKTLFALMILMSMTTYSQSIIDSNGDTIASIYSSGIITNGIDQPIGGFLENGEVHNERGDLIGTINGNEFVGPTGVVVGTIDTNNQVFDMNNSLIGSIENGITILDANNDVKGRASAAIDEKKLAAYFFFFFKFGLF